MSSYQQFAELTMTDTEAGRGFSNPSYDVSYVDARLLEQVGLLMQMTVGESQISEQKISMSVYHNKRSSFLVDVCSG